MMAIIILIIILLAIVHFIYEGIILPSIRLHLRFRIFEMRDRLRLLKIEKNDEIDDQAFKYLQESMNLAMAFLHRYDIASFVEGQRLLERDPSLYKRIEKRTAVLENCENKEFQQIREKRIITTIFALVANSAGCIILLMPILLVIAIAKGTQRFWNFVKDVTTSIFSIPEKDSDLLNHLCM